MVISSYIDNIETNLLIGKHTLHVIKWHFEEIVAKSLARCFIYVFVSICCKSCHFSSLCCWTLCCNLLSRIHLTITDQNWQTGPNESLLPFKLVFVVFWNQIGKVVQVVYISVSLIFKYTKVRYKFVYWWHWHKSSNWKTYLGCICMIFWKDCWQRFVSMLHLCACLDLLDFGSLLTI